MNQPRQVQIRLLTGHVKVLPQVCDLYGLTTLYQSYYIALLVVHKSMMPKLL